MKPRIPLPPSFATGPFASKDARAAGFGPKRLRGSDLQQPFHGIRIPGTSEPDLLLLCLACTRRLPDYAFFCGPTSARLLGVPLPSRLELGHSLHVAVPTPCPPPSGRGISGHTVTAADADTVLFQSLRISSPERTWFDLGAILNLRELVAASDFMINWRAPLTSRPKLAAAFARYSGRRGRRMLRRALDLMNDRAESPPESHTRVILAEAQIEGIAVNYPITTSGGFRYRADLALPEYRVLLEYQGDYHRDAQQFRADMTRRGRLEADGWYVFLVNAADLHDPEELVARLRRVLATRPRR